MSILSPQENGPAMFAIRNIALPSPPCFAPRSHVSERRSSATTIDGTLILKVAHWACILTRSISGGMGGNDRSRSLKPMTPRRAITMQHFGRKGIPKGPQCATSKSGSLATRLVVPLTGAVSGTRSRGSARVSLFAAWWIPPRTENAVCYRGGLVSIPLRSSRTGLAIAAFAFWKPIGRSWPTYIEERSICSWSRAFPR